MSEASRSMPDLSEMISTVTSNPKAMAMLASLLGNAPSGTPDAQEKPTPCTEKKEDCLPCPKSSTKSNKNEDRKRLLTALKPFLSPERRQAVNTLLLVLEGVSLLSIGKEPPCT